MQISPGRLIKLGEHLEFSSDGQYLTLTLRRGIAADFAEVISIDLVPGQHSRITPDEPGMYLAEWESDGVIHRRPIAVIEPDWAVCQITVGAMTSEDFAETIHAAGLAAEYYIAPERPGRVDFSFTDPRWPRYEREFGDAIYPHIMADTLGRLDPALAHENSNWDSMPVAGIHERLHYLQKWWESRGFAPLDRVASYTPSNRFVQALADCGIRILHSLVPEQNWSDGEWAINHWGMPICPFWIAPDDFRKAGPRAPGGVLGMTMNHYQVLLPHLTHWGDFVLSPSHFTRWIRAADSGEESARYNTFVRDTLRNWTSLSGDPLFFVSGHEFGRTFGTADMTQFNRRGIEQLVRLARTEKLAFATGPDVLAYFDRHQPGHPETAFRQRDYWIGVTVNKKPGQAGDSIVIERRDYKALIREGDLLPYFHYDYLVEWKFDTRDVHAPHDFAPEDRRQLSAHIDGDTLRLEAAQPLARTIPVAVWDATVEPGPFPLITLPTLEDGRLTAVLEIPAGWSGVQSLALKRQPAASMRRDDIWKMQTFGQGSDRHTYVHLDAPVVQNTPVIIELKKSARVDSATGPLGVLGPGKLELEFGFLQQWYRFWECGIEDIAPDETVRESLLAARALLSPDWQADLARHQTRLDQIASQRLKPGEKFVYQMYCGAKLPYGTRSRAAEHDQVAIPHPTFHAQESSDGVIAFAPGKSFWYHPRGLGCRIDGFPAEPGRRWKILLHTFDPLSLDARYKVRVADRELGLWSIPVDASSPGAFFEFDLDPSDISRGGSVGFALHADQKPLVYWWKERGFIAALHALWIIESEK